MLRRLGRGVGETALSAALLVISWSGLAHAQATQPAATTSTTTTPATTTSTTTTPASTTATTTTTAPSTPEPVQPASGSASTSGQVSLGTSTTTTTTTVTPPANVGGTDHERTVGGWGIGLLSAVEMRPLLPGPAYTEDPLLIAILGGRTWFDKGLGFEVGFGLNTSSGTRADDVEGRGDVADPTIWGLALHAGLPISFYDDQHYHFLIIPELNLGMATGRTKDDPNTAGDQAVQRKAWLFSVGARAGAEVQFGMIGLPMLALQGTVGLRLNYHYASTEAAENGVVLTRTRSRFEAATSSFNDPWDVFVSSIAALYYFR